MRFISTSRRTCPTSCSLAGDQGCYAEAGFHTRLHWDRLSPGATGLSAAAVAAVLVDGNDRVIAQRRTVVGAEA